MSCWITQPRCELAFLALAKSSTGHSHLTRLLAWNRQQISRPSLLWFRVKTRWLTTTAKRANSGRASFWVGRLRRNNSMRSWPVLKTRRSRMATFTLQKSMPIRKPWFLTFQAWKSTCRSKCQEAPSSVSLESLARSRNSQRCHRRPPRTFRPSEFQSSPSQEMYWWHRSI